MQVHTFLADSAADAIAQIREMLGPDAVVLNVRPAAAVAGLARLWQKPRIEVLAHVPEKPASPIQPDVLAELREELQEIRQKVEHHQPDPDQQPVRDLIGTSTVNPLSDYPIFPLAHFPTFPRTNHVGGKSYRWGSDRRSGWRIGTLLENSGLMPVHAQSVVEELRLLDGDAPPDSLAEEFQLARNVLLHRWKRPAPRDATNIDTHIFIGPPGSGKTTCLCKWLVQTALVEGRTASVWRLDGHVANTAESLSVFCEILGVPLERFMPAPRATDEGNVLFIDLPGVNPADAAAMSNLTRLLGELPNPQVHLVLNAGYETSLLLAQARAFAVVPTADLIVTHLDEEPRWGKLWNLVLGTNCTLRFLSAGQNIPGEFSEATPDSILARQFPQKQDEEEVYQIT